VCRHCQVPTAVYAQRCADCEFARGTIGPIGYHSNSWASCYYYYYYYYETTKLFTLLTSAVYVYCNTMCHFILHYVDQTLNLLLVPRVRACLSLHTYAVATPTMWNSLPLDIHKSLFIFYSLPSQHFFLYLLASLVPRPTPVPPFWRAHHWYCALYKFHLLTYLFYFYTALKIEE